MIFKHFGGRITKSDLARYKQSENWQEKRFVNLEEIILSIEFKEVPKLLYEQFASIAGRSPASPLQVIPFDREAFMSPSDKAKFIWYGHSVLMLSIKSNTILIDPMFGPDAAPIAPGGTKRFSNDTLALIDDFPEIDLIIFSHDHYDHLDYDSIQRLKTKTKAYYVALGMKRHLIKWGVNPSLITEFDWWDDKIFDGNTMTFTPTRHFAGRGLTDRAKSLWGGWVIKTPSENIWFSGDGGYGQHFKEIGRRLGPFDFAFMECGQYNVKWHNLHMFPAESVQAALDAGVKKAMPVHWAGFTLSQHAWNDPAIDFTAAAINNNLDYIVPRIGEIFNLDSLCAEKWWLKFYS